jgi:hypothetical protein
MNITNLLADIDFLCGSTSATYPVVDKIRNINQAYNDTARVIWESDGAWAFDDSNNTDGPVAYKTLANASASYTVPTTAIRIEGVEVKDISGKWLKMVPFNAGSLDISREEYLSSPGTPSKYELNGNEIRLYPPPATDSVTMTSGMAVRLSRGVTEFPTTATTETPGIPSPFHRILSYAAAIDFTQDENQRKFLIAQKARLESGLTRFYSKRATEFKTSIKPKSKRTWRQYI